MLLGILIGVLSDRAMMARKVLVRQVGILGLEYV